MLTKGNVAHTLSGELVMFWTKRNILIETSKYNTVGEGVVYMEESAHGEGWESYVLKP